MSPDTAPAAVPASDSVDLVVVGLDVSADRIEVQIEGWAFADKPGAPA